MFPPSLVWYRAKNLITPGRELSSDRRQSPRQACLPGYRQSRKGGDQRPVGAGYRAGDVEVLFQVVCPSTVRSLLRCQSCPLTLTTFRSRKPKTGKRGSRLTYEAPHFLNTKFWRNFPAISDIFRKAVRLACSLSRFSMPSRPFLQGSQPSRVFVPPESRLASNAVCTAPRCGPSSGYSNGHKMGASQARHSPVFPSPLRNWLIEENSTRQRVSFSTTNCC